MEERQEHILKLVIENYIETAEPIGSHFLVADCGLELSGATIRNEMRDLEEQGFLTHPHTSSGRIPTQTGYQYYVEHLMKPKEIQKKLQKEIEGINKETKDNVQALKQVGRVLADEAKSAVVVAFGSNSLYYTGISNLFSQIEFRDHATTVSVSTIFDQCEERIDDVYEVFEKSSGVNILVGKNNPFGSACSLVGSRLGKKSLFAILGPMRMDYGKNVGLVGFVQNLVMAHGSRQSTGQVTRI